MAEFERGVMEGRLAGVRHWFVTRRGPLPWRRMHAWLAQHPAVTHPAMGIVSVLFGCVLLISAGVPAPGVHDEFSYLLAADTFAQGRMTNATHPMWRHFETFHVLQQPTYMSKYYPAQGAFLAVGQVLTGEAFAGVLLGGAVMCAALSYFAFAWFRPRRAVLMGMFVVITFGVNTYWTNSYWGGCLAAAGGGLAFGALRHLSRRLTWRDPLLLAVGILLLTTTRLAECVVLLPIIGGWLAWWLWRGENATLAQKTVRVVAPLVVYGVLVVGFHLYYNNRVTGSPLTFPYLVHFKQHEVLPATYFESIAREPEYVDWVVRKFYVESNRHYFPTPMTLVNLLAVEHTKWLYFTAFYTHYLVVPDFLASWLVLLPLLVVGRRKWAAPAYGVCLALAGLQLIFVYYLPHYSAPVLALGLSLWLMVWQQIACWRWRGMRIGRGLSRAYAAAIVGAFIVTFGSGVASGKRPMDFFTAGGANSSLKMRPEVEQEIRRRASGGRHLVLVKYLPGHNVHQEWVFNGASPDSQEIVWARSFGEERDADILQYYKDRNTWHLVCDDEKGTWELDRATASN